MSYHSFKLYPKTYHHHYQLLQPASSLSLEYTKTTTGVTLAVLPMFVNCGTIISKYFFNEYFIAQLIVCNIYSNINCQHVAVFFQIIYISHYKVEKLQRFKMKHFHTDLL